MRGPHVGCLSALALGLFVATFLAYSPCLHGEFLWDDGPFLVDNPFVTSPGGLTPIWLTNRNADYWPVTYSVLWALWQLWGEGASSPAPPT